MPKQMGYLMIDHRASPGLPAEVARQFGYDPKLVGEGKLYETETMTCSHCNAVVVKNPLRTRERALCMQCNNVEGHYICDGCDYLRTQPGYVHAPFRKHIDDHLSVAANPCSTRDLPTMPLGSPPKLILPPQGS